MSANVEEFDCPVGCKGGCDLEREVEFTWVLIKSVHQCSYGGNDQVDAGVVGMSKSHQCSCGGYDTSCGENSQVAVVEKTKSVVGTVFAPGRKRRRLSLRSRARVSGLGFGLLAFGLSLSLDVGLAIKMF